MAYKHIIKLVVLLVVTLSSSPLLAQVNDDDDFMDDDCGDDDDSTGEGFGESLVLFDSPEELEPDTEYEFDISVYNASYTKKANGQKRGEWIYAVDLTLPSEGYAVYEDELYAPDPLHGGASEGELEIDAWEVSFDPSRGTISWQAFGVVTSAEYGDIREGEVLQFMFIAATDGQATDGFSWVLYGDMGEVVSGTVYITDDNDGDDDSADDDSADDDSANDDYGADDENWNPFTSEGEGRKSCCG